MLSGTLLSNLLDRYFLFRIRTKRDPESFARLYDRYVEAIYRFAFLKLPSKEEAQDITAETFTKCWQYLNETKQVTNVRALLYQIARNAIADYYRTRRNEVPLDELVTFEDGKASTANRGERRLDIPREDNAEGRAEFALVLTHVERLKEDYRDVLLLRLVDDLPFSVIADILEKKAGHVRVIYHRALKALKELETNS